MRQYIVNLTNNLIGKNGYDASFHRINNPKKFVECVKIDLEAGDVGNMSPATLGEIMCSLETGDVLVVKDVLFSGVHFSGNCEELLRELVSLCLAYVIKDRITRTVMPPWQGRVSGFHSSTKKIIDDHAARRNKR